MSSHPEAHHCPTSARRPGAISGCSWDGAGVGCGVDIRELDASDPAARRAWYEVMDRSARADRPHALLEAFDAFELTVTEPGEHARRIRLEARDGDALVGVAELELPLTENLDVGWCEVNVLPEHRRRGAGRLLWQEVVDRARAAGRTRVGGEVSVAPVDGGPGLAFAASMGAVEKHREDHLLLDLPLAQRRAPRSIRRTTSSPGAVAAPTSTARPTWRCATR